MRLIVAILIVAAFAVGPANALAATSLSEAARVDELFLPWEKPESPGCAVGVMKDGKILYERGYGIADLDHDVKITPKTVFHVGSMSKQFTAAAILMLARDRKISLDDPIRKYVPEVPDFGVPVTLRELLHHTSGLRDQWELLALDGWRIGNDLVTDGDVLYLISRQQQLNFTPGSDFAYCNSGFTLPAQVVARVSGRSFREFTAINIFEPLGMSNTHFRDNHGETVKQIAYGYEEQNHAFDLSVPNYDTVGATSLLTTVEDMARWDENFYTAKVGGPIVEELQQTGKLNDGTPIHYASGLYVYNYRGLKVVDHGGADAGYIADLMRFPAQHFSVATLCHLSSIDPTRVNQQIADIYLAKALRKDIPDPPPFHVRLDQLSAKAGIYVDSAADGILRLNLRSDALWADSFFGPSFKMQPIDETHFIVPETGSEIEFPQHSDTRLIWTNKREELGSDKPFQFDRVPSYAPARAQLREFVGLYRSPELDVPYPLRLEGDRLMFQQAKQSPTLMQPVTNDLFAVGATRIRFRRDARGRISGFLLSTVRLRNLWFERVADGSIRAAE